MRNSGVRLQAAFATSEILDFNGAETLRHLPCTVMGLEIAGHDGEFRRRTACDDLRRVSIGRVPLEETRYYVTNTVLRTSFDLTIQKPQRPSSTPSCPPDWHSLGAGHWANQPSGEKTPGFQAPVDAKGM